MDSSEMSVYHRSVLGGEDICGDVNQDRTVDLSDVINLANYYFGLGDPPKSEWASDVNCDSKRNLTDVILIAQFFFGQPITLDCC